MVNRDWERTIPAISCIIVSEKGDGQMSRFIAALKHRVGATLGFSAYLADLQRPCVTSKTPTDCDGIPSLEEAREDYQAAARTQRYLI